MVENQAEGRALISGILGEALFTIRTVVDGHSALSVVEESRVDLVLLALNLPDIDGLDVLRRLRKVTDVPVIIVSARTHETDRVAGLEAGADDYVVKPFSPAELVARIRTHLRRKAHRPDDGRLEFPGLTIDLARREVLVVGAKVELRHREFDLLVFLASSPGQVFSRAQLLEHVWGSAQAWQKEATVTEHIRRIRDKIEADSDAPRWIQTLHGVGYRFDCRLTGRPEFSRPAHAHVARTRY